jgi:tRNA modification GTPase|tara:strand:+ start:3485 stop:4858 length:1374 start_codon:yes stop_codon:yes gene_type:complete
MNQDTICCISTALGQGAISLIRVSGSNAINITNRFFKSYTKKALSKVESNKAIVGQILDQNDIIDEVIVTIFRSPKSYTGENIIEIACHGSAYIQDKIIQLLIEHGCRLANRGEFTLRAFLNGKLDLSQAEAVAELIASDNKKAHNLALKQMRGGITAEIKLLRDRFIKFGALIELELDFSGEDVEFADRNEFLILIQEIKNKVKNLLKSFKYGNVIKHGIPITIVGNPNSGKSTLLNNIIQEERAIVSNIEGTTRDTIEESITIDGYKLRFTDTAGLRQTNNEIEKIGIAKTYNKINQSAFVLYLFDKMNINTKNLNDEIIKIRHKASEGVNIIILANKSDLNNKKIDLSNSEHIINISAKTGDGIEKVLNYIIAEIEKWKDFSDDIIITNQRHFQSLTNVLSSTKEVENGIKSNLSGEFLAIDIKKCLQSLGEITGEITNENLLDSIFRDFCIGK